MANAVRPPGFDVLLQALKRRDRIAVREIVATMIATGAPLGGRWSQVAQIMRSDGEVTLAIGAAGQWLRAQGGDRATRFAVANLLAHYGRLDDAADVLRGGRDRPIDDDWQACHFLGTIATQRHDFGRAKLLLERAVHLAPGSGRSWHALAQLLDPERDTELVAALYRSADAVAGGPPLDQAAWFNAVGCIAAARNEHADAYRSFAACAQIMAGLRSYDAVADDAAVATICAEWTGERFAALAGSGVSSGTGCRPIIVAGPPRSGTTLVARILAAHPDVGGGDEVDLFHAAAGPRDPARIAGVEALTPDARSTIADRYRRVLSERSGPAPSIVDKTLNAGRHLGAIAALLPDAPLLWVRRDPDDTGWSAFRTFFPEGLGWSWLLEGAAAHLRAEARLHAHWQAVLGPRLLTISYEALVRDPGDWTRRILRHCSLAEDGACFRPEQAGGAVMTASTIQVRRAVHAHAIGAAIPYRRFYP